MTDEQTDLFGPQAIPDDLRKLWLERGFAEGLLERAAELRALRQVRNFLRRGGSDESFVRRRLDWHERLTLGDLRGREATEADNEAFSDLMANSPEEVGHWEITTERGPNAFAQFRLQENVNVLVIEHRGVLVACCSFSHRKTIVAGQRFLVRYGQALRVRREYRRLGYGDQVRSLSWGVGAARPSDPQYDIMRTQNFAVVNWWTKYVPDFWKDVPEKEGEVPGVRVSVLQCPRRPFDGDPRGIRKVRPDDIPRCVVLINHTHKGLDLFRPYTAPFLESRLDDGYWGPKSPNWPKVYDWDDYYVLEENGRIVACAGLWDRGRDARDRWRHQETGEERVIAVTSVLDFGFARGRADAMGRLLGYLIGETDRLGRDYLTVPLDHLPRLAELLAPHEPLIDTRALRWGLAEPQVTKPYIDLAYW
jgi:hypothetical protein